MSLSTGRISEFDFKVVVGVFFGLAILATSVRIPTRLWLDKRLHMDDYFLLFSCMCLIAATGLLYQGIPAIFFVAEITFNPATVLGAGLSQAGMLREIVYFQKINWAYLAVSWTSIFAIKFGFLSLFRHLVDRIPFMYRFWKGVVVFTGLVFAFSVGDAFIACSKLGISALECAATPGALRKGLALGATAISLDIVTDLLIVIIPISLLWRVQIRSRQKLGLAAFLCLSLCMVVVAIIRVAGLHYQGKFDNTWIFLWQHVESCIAVTMLSLTAFRSIFVSTNASRSPNKARPWIPSTTRLLRRFKKSTGDEKNLDDLTIPSATLTGMSAMMYRTKGTESMDESTRSSSWPRTPEHHYDPYFPS